MWELKFCMNQNNKYRFGMVGGGEGAFIGAVHRMAAELDGLAEIVCGCFSKDPQKSLSSGTGLYGLAADRCYASFTEMMQAEAALDPAQRMQFVVIATPNHVHFPVAKAAMEHGFHVVCDKPVTFSLDEALQLKKIRDRVDCQFAVTHNYTGYPMIKEARELVASGRLGNIRRVNCEYLQGWLAVEAGENKQAEWRTDPSRSGVAGCFGDIGSHAENLVSYVTGLEIDSLCADLSTFVPGRQLDDDGNVLLRFKGGARGVISASQIAVGKENDLKLQVYGEAGGLEWSQTEPNSLVVRWADAPLEIRRTGGPANSARSTDATRIPPGHPEGYLEAFAEVYRNFYRALDSDTTADFPSLEDGIRGMRFIESVVESHQAGAQWLEF